MQTCGSFPSCWIFHDNIAARQLPFAAAMIERLWTECVFKFSELPLYFRGNSKEIRRTTVEGLLIARFLPTLYSHTTNRAGTVPGTDTLRTRISRIFWRELHRRNITTCYLACGSEFILLSEHAIPPVEVVVKRALVGTPAHIYYDLFTRHDRFGHPFVKGELHPPYVRFDYRNPLVSAGDERLRDEMLPPQLADRLIDTAAAKGTALRMFSIVDEMLRAVGLQMLDVCFFLDESGTICCGEISPDNMRIKSASDALDFDKDLWRKNRTADEIVTQWGTLLSRLEGAHAAD
jgi:phosphoribosylaminoimidazole-succinocarboxamide synthase